MNITCLNIEIFYFVFVLAEISSVVPQSLQDSSFNRFKRNALFISGRRHKVAFHQTISLEWLFICHADRCVILVSTLAIETSSKMPFSLLAILRCPCAVVKSIFPLRLLPLSRVVPFSNPLETARLAYQNIPCSCSLSNTAPLFE